MTMQLTFCLFHYFPFGGLQRDFMRILQLCQRKGHNITVYTMNWVGEKPAGIDINILPSRGFTHTQRIRTFICKLNAALVQNPSDLVIGFNRMPSLDVYFASDLCFAEKVAHKAAGLLRFLPRYRFYLNLEKAVFSSESQTQCLLLTARQMSSYQRYYQTPNSRLHILPPGLNPDWQYPNQASDMRLAHRKKQGILDNQVLLLSVGSHFSTKGLTRSLIAFANLPESHRQRSCFVIVGKGNCMPYLRQAKKLGIEKNVHFLGVSDDVMLWMLSADLLLHPSLYESAGMVLLEALTLGLPIITTSTCGYANYIKAADAGVVLSSPFKQKNYNQALIDALDSVKLSVWHKHALHYASTHNLSGLTEAAVEWIEELGKSPRNISAEVGSPVKD